MPTHATSMSEVVQNEIKEHEYTDAISYDIVHILLYCISVQYLFLMMLGVIFKCREHRVRSLYALNNECTYAYTSVCTYLPLFTLPYSWDEHPVKHVREGSVTCTHATGTLVAQMLIHVHTHSQNMYLTRYTYTCTHV